MSTYAQLHAIGWRRITKRTEACPICGKHDWCMVNHEKGVALCARTPSEVAWRDGQGYIHRLDGGYVNEQLAKSVHLDTPPPEQRVSQQEWERYVGESLAGMQRNVDGASYQRLGAELGLDPGRLELGFSVGYDTMKRAYTFPMYWSRGKLCGVRLRSLNSGRKYAVTGSSNGLFIDHSSPHIDPRKGPLFVVEGPTDLCMLTQAGVSAVGRPSATAGNSLLAKYCSASTDVVIIKDFDPKGSHARQLATNAANNLASMLKAWNRSVRIVYPLKGKDVREWLRDVPRERVRDLLMAVADGAQEWEAAA